MRWLEDWFGQPLEPHYKAAVAERVVRWVTAPMFFIAGSTALTIYLTLGGREPTRYLPSVIAFVATCGVFWLGRRGKWLMAAAALSVSSVLAIMSAVLLNSVHAPAYWGGVALLCVVVPVFGVRWGALTWLILACSGAVWLALDANGLSHGVRLLPPVTIYAQYLCYAAVVLFVVGGSHRVLTDALYEARSERARALAAREAEAQAELAFHAVFDQASMAIVLLTANGDIVRLNPLAQSLLGMRSLQLANAGGGSPLLRAAVWNEPQRAQLAQTLAAASAGRAARCEVCLSEGPHAQRVYQVSMSPFHTAGGVLRYVLFEAADVSEIVETRSLLAQARRLEALGKLSGSVAHDFNNMLAAISGVCEQLDNARGRQDWAHVGSDVALIRSAVVRATDLTRKLLAFGHGDRFAAELISVDERVSELARLFQRTLRKNIGVVVEAGAERARVRVDPAALDHALLNLVLNAQDAMPAGGTVLLRTRRETVSARGEVTPQPSRLNTGSAVVPGEYVVIDVEDNGSGMSAEVRDRIFEPFYTTKARGSGLGLSAVHGTMRSHGGAVAVRSREGEGSTLSLYLPVADYAAKTCDKTSDPMQTPQARRLPPQLSVYFADDEPLVRKAVTAMLRVHGCQVTSFESGEQLLSALAQGEPPNVVITDLAMPGMSGLRLVQALRTSHPGLPLLLVTGYTDDDLTEVFGAGAPPRLLRKPFGSSELLAALSEVLELSRAGLSAVDRDEPKEPRSGLISVSAHALSGASELTAKLDASRFSAPRRRRFS